MSNYSRSMLSGTLPNLGVESRYMVIPFEDLNLGFIRHFTFVSTINPVKYVDKKIKPNGIQVPKRLWNISILLLITRATRKKSISITIRINMAAVCIGDVNWNFLKYNRVIRENITGAPIAWTISVFWMDIKDIPMNIIAPQSAQPSNPRVTMIKICLKCSCNIVTIWLRIPRTFGKSA